MAKGGDREKCCRVFLTISREKYFFAYNIKKVRMPTEVNNLISLFFNSHCEKKAHIFNLNRGKKTELIL